MKKEFLNPYFLIPFFMIQLYLLTFVFIPFLAVDRLQSWDAAGHFFAAWFNKTYLFPNYTGWNPFFYAGYPQDTFYPPLYHYLIVLLSFIFGLTISLKFINVFSVFILPISFYYFARKHEFSPEESSLIMLLMMLPVVSLSLNTGGTLHSLFVIGLGANSLALPLLFFFIGKLRDEQSGKNLLILTMLLTGIMLSHFIVTLVALMTVAIYLVLNFIEQKRDSLIYLVRILVSSVLICGFWLVPLIAFIPYYGGSFMSMDLFYFVTFPVLTIILLGTSLIIIEKDEKVISSPLIIMIILFAIIPFVDFGEYGMPFHPYRFLFYLLVLIMILPYRMIFNKLQGTMKLLFVLLFALIIGYYFYKISGPGTRMNINQNQLYRYKTDLLNYTNLDIGKLDGRIIVFGGEKNPHVHDLRHFLAQESHNYLLKGLFIESAVNGKFIGSLDVNTIRGGVLWGIESIPMAKDQYLTHNPATLQKNLDLFNVNYLLINDVRPPLIPEKQLIIEHDKPPYNLYRIGRSGLVELLTYKPIAVEEKLWGKATKEWFGSEDRHILVKGETVPNTVAQRTDKVELLNMNEQQTYLKLYVSSKEDVPVFIKISYFPRWHAYVNGRETKIYTASPYLMLVYGKGIIELKYQNSVVDYLGWAMSIFGIAYFVFSIIKKV